MVDAVVEDRSISSMTVARCFFLPCLALLTGCAGGAARPPPIATPARLVSVGRPAVVVAIRAVDIGPGDGSLAGVNAVLAALSQPAVSSRITVQEVVVSQPVNTPASIGGTYAGFTAGQDVTISNIGGRTVLRGD